MLDDLTKLAFVLHVGGGTLGLVSGTVAIFAPKGGRLHRMAGSVFIVAMLVMAVFADYLAIVVPDHVNFVIGTFAFYLIGTAWLTVWRKQGAIGLPEKAAFAVILFLLAPFAILSFQLVFGLKPFLTSTVAFKGPVLIAIYGFTLVTATAAFSDARVIWTGGISGVPRIARHLWRMCLGLTLAAGSAFTNGLPRLLPPPHHVTAIFFLPQFIPLGLMIFWLIRVRFTGWRRAGALPEPA
ncbi:MAG TPA: hypothetical protein VGG10_04440 [Rhizomicrobium sp.]|jgi:uncharacterized membrane protein